MLSPAELSAGRDFLENMVPFNTTDKTGFSSEPMFSGMDLKPDAFTLQVTEEVLAPFKRKAAIIKKLQGNPDALKKFHEGMTSTDSSMDSACLISHVGDTDEKESEIYYDTISEPQMSPDSQFSPSCYLPNQYSDLDSLPMSTVSTNEISESMSHDLSEVEQSKPSHILPPCRVCGDKASGFHYGANTCEACKGFFRRSLKKDKLEYKCTKNGDCKIMKGRRNNCPLCRYNKCLAVGMSKEAIKTGRYTHAKRTSDIIEVKKLQNKDEPTPVSPAAQPHMSPPQVKVKSELIQPELLDLTNHLYTAHQMLFPNWHRTLDSGELLPRMKKYLDDYRLKKETYGNLTGLSDEDFNTFYNSTGLKLDNRHEMMETMTKHMEIAVTKFVQYAKAIPGFSTLPLEDQANLIKMSRFEIWLVSAHKFFNFELEVVSGPLGRSYHKEEMSKLWEVDYIECLFLFCKKMQKLELSYKEIAMLKCVVLTFADRCELHSRDEVDKIQWDLLMCLQYLLNSSRRFTQLMDLIVALRDLTDWHHRLAKQLVLKWPVIQNHPLILELCSF